MEGSEAFFWLDDDVGSVDQMEQSEEPFAGRLVLGYFVLSHDNSFNLKHWNNPEKTTTSFQCKYCEQAFSERHLLNSHLIEHCLDDVTSCYMCVRGFKRGDILQKHLEKTHIADKLHVFNSSKKPYSKRKVSAKKGLNDKKSTMKTKPRKKQTTRKGKGNLNKTNITQQFCSLHLPEGLLVDGEEPFQCSVCQKCYPQKVNLDRHMLNHMCENEQNCSICTKGTPKKKRVASGENQKKTPRKQSAKTMKKNSDKQLLVDLKSAEEEPTPGTSNSDKAEKSKVPTEKKELKCMICNKIFRAPCYLRDHLRSHSGEKPFKCPTCEKCFTQKSHLNTHIKIVHLDERSHQCTLCGKCFAQSSSLAYHMIAIHNHEVPLKCNTCGKKYTEKDATSEDPDKCKCGGTLERMPDRFDRFKCEICGKGFTKPRSLKEHKVRKILDCSACDKKFCTYRALKEHMMTHEELKDKPFKCKVCDKSFSWAGNLLSHMVVHTGEKKYMCSTCGLCFTQKGNVIKHERVHTGERPYKCTFCPKAFTQIGGLSRHLMIHNGTKLHKCDICDKSFVQKNNLLDHLWTHSNEKPHECSYCGKGFIQKRQLKAHVTVHETGW